MPRNPKSAVVAIRMSPSLRDGLKEAADEEGCSLNAYIVQVLAAAAGHRARFRGIGDTGPAPSDERDDLRQLPRKHGGNPVDWKAQDRHRLARSEFYRAAAEEHGSAIAVQMMTFVDFGCPWHYVEWKDLGAELWPHDFEPRRSEAS